MNENGHSTRTQEPPFFQQRRRCQGQPPTAPTHLQSPLARADTTKRTTTSSSNKSRSAPPTHFSPLHRGRPEKQSRKMRSDGPPPRPLRRQHRNGEQRGRTKAQTPPPSPPSRCRREPHTHLHLHLNYTRTAASGAPPYLTAPERRPEAEGSGRFTGETLSCAVASLSPPLHCSEGKAVEAHPYVKNDSTFPQMNPQLF